MGYGLYVIFPFEFYFIALLIGNFKRIMFSKLGLVRPTIYRLGTDKIISCRGHLDTSVYRNHSFSFCARPPFTGSGVDNRQFLGRCRAWCATQRNCLFKGKHRARLVAAEHHLCIRLHLLMSKRKSRGCCPLPSLAAKS